MPRSERRVCVEPALPVRPHLLRLRDACRAPGQAVWKTLGDVGLMKARRLRDEFLIDARPHGPAVALGPHIVRRDR